MDAYVEAQRSLPSREIILQTKDADFYHFKTDIFSGLMTYSTDKFNASNLVTISKERVFEIVAMNKKGQKPLRMISDADDKTRDERTFAGGDILENQSITRFDDDRKNQTNKKRKPRRRRPDQSPGSRNRQGGQPAGGSGEKDA